MTTRFTNKKDVLVRVDQFMVAVGDPTVPYNNSGYINVGPSISACLNAEYAAQNFSPSTGNPAQTSGTVADPVGPAWVDNANFAFTSVSYRANTWMTLAPTSYVVSAFNPNNFGVKVVFGPFYRYKRGFNIRDADTLVAEAQASVNSGAIIFGIGNGPALQDLNYNGVHMDRSVVDGRFKFNKVSPHFRQRLTIIRKFISVLLPANARHDFRIRLPGFRRTPTDVVLADWQYRYKYTHCTFKWSVFSPTMFDAANAVVTAFGAGPGWALTQVKPAFAIHGHCVHRLRLELINQPFYFLDSNPRAVARPNVPNPKFNSQAIVEQAPDNAF